MLVMVFKGNFMLMESLIILGCFRVLSGIISSRKPKPWHLVKKRGIVPDGQVQARLTQFQQLTNQGRGESVGINSSLGLTNGKAG